MNTPVHVAVAAIVNERDEVLLSLRPNHVHQGGLWEFPGGKLEAGETVRAALDRELHEELGITARRARPLIRVQHDYPDKSVVLDVWRVSEVQGEPHGREGQPVRWVPVRDLGGYRFPQANMPIVAAVRLPPLYFVTGEPAGGESDFLSRLDDALRAGVRLVQLRAKSLDAASYRRLAVRALELCRRHGAELLLNAEPELVRELDAHGVHLPSARLMRLRERPLPPRFRVAASCHDLRELQRARVIGVDFVVAAPVLPTRSHPGAPVLRWRGLQVLTENASLPVYALGGMRAEHMSTAFAHGAQGLAVVSAIWDAPDVAFAARDVLARTSDVPC
jgi:8-oxo-dGTP diphosphatase